MKLCRFGDARLGLVEDGVVRDVTSALDALPAYRYPLPRHDLLIAHLSEVRTRVTALAPNAPQLPLESVRLLAPLANPGKIVAAPVNYKTHLEEARADPALHHGNPGHTADIHHAGLFLKATSALAGPGEGIGITRLDRRTDHEIELVVVIGSQARGVTRTEALRCVAGYTIGLDITIRGSEDRSFRKSPDGFAVLGPWLVTADEIPDPDALELRLDLNGETRQRTNTSDLIVGVAELIEIAASCYTLYPGDVLFTGTPVGVGPIAPGDVLAATIERIGTMTVDVRLASSPVAEATALRAGT